jgi:hypothetical protein
MRLCELEHCSTSQALHSLLADDAARADASRCTSPLPSRPALAATSQSHTPKVGLLRAGRIAVFACVFRGEVVDLDFQNQY